jgi:cell wall-associated NlpC family hydrolase
MTLKTLIFICAFLFCGVCQADEHGYELQLADQLAQNTPVTLPTLSLLPFALSQEGVSYHRGGTSPSSGFDCSGFVRYVFDRAEGLSLPHGANAISKLGEQIKRSELRPGDLVFFHFVRNTISHVGIYLGNHQFIHASSTRTGDVMVSDLDDSFWVRHFTLARRLDKTASTLPAQ